MGPSMAFFQDAYSLSVYLPLQQGWALGKRAPGEVKSSDKFQTLLLPGAESLIPRLQERLQHSPLPTMAQNRGLSRTLVLVKWDSSWLMRV